MNGLAVDRPAVCFYELNGLDENPSDGDPFNIYSDPSWLELINLTREKSDCIVMRPLEFKHSQQDPLANITTARQWFDNSGSRFQSVEIRAESRTLKTVTRRDRDTNTIWTVEHLLKNIEDIKAYLELPAMCGVGDVHTAGILKAENDIGNSGIVMLDTPDPLCMAAGLFEMQTYLSIAMFESDLFRRLLDRFSETLSSQIAAFAEALPGRLWRIYGSEYACPPYLPPNVFRDYVVKYDAALIESIHKYGGLVRIHCHGRIKAVLDYICSMGCDAIDPIEPPPQGDVELAYVRQKYGDQLVLFGNLEISDIENLPTDEFEQKIISALEYGTAGKGRGFVLMPSACPYGRSLSKLTLRNYVRMVEVAESWN